MTGALGLSMALGFTPTPAIYFAHVSHDQIAAAHPEATGHDIAPAWLKFELAQRADADPEAALALLDEAICGERGSRYHGKADRKTRCSPVYYTGMHLLSGGFVRRLSLVNPTPRRAGSTA